MNGVAEEFGERVNILPAADVGKVVVARAFDYQKALLTRRGGFRFNLNPALKGRAKLTPPLCGVLLTRF